MKEQRSKACLKRLRDVLDSMKFNAVYYDYEEVFLLEDQNILIYAGPWKKIYTKMAPEQNHICITEKGELIYKDGTDADIMYCTDCRKFFFYSENKYNSKKCPHCKSQECDSPKFKKFTQQGKIPGWISREEHYLADSKELKDKLNNTDNSENTRENLLLKKLLRETICIKSTEDKIIAIEALRKKYPNFVEVIDYIISALKISRIRKNSLLLFRPILLLGGPGCGKTSFVTELCIILQGKNSLKIDLGNEVANFAISGSSSQYNKSKEGLILDTLLGNDYNPVRNPIIHFDELDKINTKDSHCIESVFYSLLEKNTAKRFFENFIELNIDASYINYVFTANSIEGISPALLSRIKVFKVPDYSETQFKEIVINNYYHNWLKNNNMEPEYFPQDLCPEIIDMIYQECQAETRRIEDALITVVMKTQYTDHKTGHIIALFGPDEISAGWENFAGSSLDYEKKWKLEDYFPGAAYPNLEYIENLFVTD